MHSSGRQLVWATLAMVWLPCAAAAQASAGAVSASNPIVEVRAVPEAVQLQGKSSYVQLLLTALATDGSQVDVTRRAELVEASPLVEVSDTGLIRAVRDGEGSLVFDISGVRATVPVRVGGQDVDVRAHFITDVLPILSHRGCNSGSCHGSADGRNGFKLSLRGYDAEFDHAALTDDLAGRRFDRVSPAQSLFLLKPTGSVPHEGGRLMRDDEADFDVLLSWVAGGSEFEVQAPRVTGITLQPEKPLLADAGSEQQFRVVATFTDGSERDVTAHAFFESNDIEVSTVDDAGLATGLRRGDAAILARYEGSYASTRLFVMGDRSGFEWHAVPEHNYIDELVYARLRQITALPSDVCDDATFLRRLYLDLTGRPPQPKEVETFLLDRRETKLKRDELIDRLIGSAAFVEHWTNRWSDLLQVNSKFLGGEGAMALREWVRAAVASNLPYDEFVMQLLTARGSTVDNPPAAYFKILREPDIAMENTTQLFLGTRFNCNKCHDHPFERWTKDQHWEMASYFAQIDRKDAPGSKKMPGSVVMQAGQKPPAFEELIGDGDAGQAVDAEGRSYEASFPFAHAGQAEEVAGPLRQQLAEWLTDAHNPYFARSYVNRLWSYLLGVGIIDPVDDIRASNPATFPVLLERLTQDFVEGGFDVRRMLRRICRSRVYQHSVASNEWNEDDRIHFAHALARRLPAEVLFDAIHQATGSRPRLPGLRSNTMASELVDPSVKVNDGFLDMFGRPPRESSCECERGTGVSLGQALNLVNGSTLADAVRDPDNLIAELAVLEPDAGSIIRELYLSFLCRPPTDAEVARLRGMFDATAIENVSALSESDRNELRARMAKWEAALPSHVWHPVELGNLWSEGGASLEALADGSVLLSGKLPERDKYTLVAATKLEGITGLRLEALAHDSLPAKGPGRAENGNFVLSKFEARAVSLDALNEIRAVPFSAATASFEQSGFAAKRSLGDEVQGWAISPQLGKKQVAYFEVGGEYRSSGRTLLIINMDQQYGSKHTLGCFRVSVTNSPQPIRHSKVPEEIRQIVAVPTEQRDSQQVAQLHKYYMNTDKAMREKVRLGATQDLAWALANSSAFLFNR